jgi:hypothetical protein
MDFESYAVGEYQVQISVWKESWSSQYSAQVSCPVTGCSGSYTAIHRNTKALAVAAMKTSVRTHFNRKHRES